MIITTAIFRIPMIGNHELLGSLAHWEIGGLTPVFPRGVASIDGWRRSVGHCPALAAVALTFQRAAARPGAFWVRQLAVPRFYGLVSKKSGGYGEPQRFSIRTCIISGPHIPHIPHIKVGITCFSKVTLGKPSNRAPMLHRLWRPGGRQRRPGGLDSERFNGELFERVVCETETGDPKWRAVIQVIYSGFILDLGQWNVWEPASVHYVACFLEL